jgi:hypothetical protein
MRSVMYVIKLHLNDTHALSREFIWNRIWTPQKYLLYLISVWVWMSAGSVAFNCVKLNVLENVCWCELTQYVTEGGCGLYIRPVNYILNSRIRFTIDIRHDIHTSVCVETDSRQMFVCWNVQEAHVHEAKLTLDRCVRVCVQNWQ